MTSKPTGGIICDFPQDCEEDFTFSSIYRNENGMRATASHAEFLSGQVFCEEFFLNSLFEGEINPPGGKFPGDFDYQLENNFWYSSQPGLGDSSETSSFNEELQHFSEDLKCLDPGQERNKSVSIDETGPSGPKGDPSLYEKLVDALIHFGRLAINSVNVEPMMESSSSPETLLSSESSTVMVDHPSPHCATQTWRKISFPRWKEVELLLQQRMDLPDGQLTMQTAAFLDKSLLLNDSELIFCKGLFAFTDAMTAGDKDYCVKLLPLLQQESNPSGTATQRILFYFLEALSHRAAGTGYHHSSAPQILTQNVKWLIQLSAEYCKFIPAPRFWSAGMNAAFFTALQGKPNIHIVDLCLFTEQWGPLLQALGSQAKVRPNVRFTAIDVIEDSYVSMGLFLSPQQLRLELESEAVRAGVRLEFEVVQTRLIDLTCDLLRLRKGESVGICCGFRLTSMPDSTILRSNPRDSVLKVFHDCKPEVLTICDYDADFNSPFFLPRMKAAFLLFLMIFKYQETVASPSCLFRQAFENILSRQLTNVIACEGIQRSLRSECVKGWQHRMEMLGYRGLAFHCEIANPNHVPLQSMVKPYAIYKSRDFWQMKMLGHPVVSVMAWKP